MSGTCVRLRHVARMLNQTSSAPARPELHGPGDTFELQEATIESIQAALKAGALTCVELVEMYLKRIAAYNGQSCQYPRGLLGDEVELVANSGQLNALLTLNLRPAAREAHGLSQRTARSLTDSVDRDPSMPDALETAASLDATLASTGELVGPLHGVVFAIKDQYDTFDMRTTSAADVDYADDRPPRDANFVSKLRSAGAIILAKANMGEYATGNPRSSFGGVIVNAFDTTRSPQGSSSGSATAVSANLVTCAIGEETGTSIRGPAAYASCVGIAATQELVSRHGMIDSGINTRCGPICRTVVDAAKVLTVIAGYDAEDELTSLQLGRTPHAPYETFCAKPSVANIKPLQGLRIGVMREYMDRSAFSVVDHENIDIIDQAIAQLASLGATVVEPAEGDGGLFTPYLRKYYPQLMNATFIANWKNQTSANEAKGRDALAQILHLAEHPSNTPQNLNMLTIGGDGQFVGQGRFSLEKYLHMRGDANIQTIRDLIDKARFFEDERYDMQRPDLESRLGDTTMDSSVRMQFRFAIQQIVYAAMADLSLDAFVAPTSNAPAPKLGAPRPLGRHKRPDIWSFLGSQGIPNITVPAGFTTHVYDRVRDDTVDPTSIDDDDTVEGCENARLL